MSGLRVLSRNWCHLCDELLDALAPIAAEHNARIEVIDVDSDDRLEVRWGELVPVVLTEDQQHLCHYHLDERAVRAYLERFPLKSSD